MPRPEPGGNQIVDHSRIECVSGKRHSFRTQDSMRLIAHRSRSDAKNGKVAGAAAEVANKDELIVVERAFVEKSGRNGLVLENHRADSSFRQRACQPVKGKLVIVFCIRVGITNRAADGDGPGKRA